MTLSPREESARVLARIGAESAEHVRRSGKSIEDSNGHVRSSRTAIQRSLKLLGDSAPAIRDKG